MNLYEYHGKRLLAEAGILIPPGEIVTTPEQAEEVATRLGGERWMIKAQVPLQRPRSRVFCKYRLVSGFESRRWRASGE